MFNYALELATMQEDLMSHPDFGIYYPDAQIRAVLPKMISESMKCSPKAVTRALEGIGMEVRPKRVTITNKMGEKSSKKVRPLLVPNKKKWQEITQRYYFNDGGGDIPECPDCLRGMEYITKQTDLSEGGSSPGSVPSTSGTCGTCGTDTNQLDDGSDQNGTHVPDVPLPMYTPHENFHDWLAFHQIPDDITPDRYTLMPESHRAGVRCKCRGCGKPGENHELYYIPARQYQQICVDCLREFQELYEKETKL
jgi:hypothetical protein